MAMRGFESEDFSAPMAEINTTPLVDVMLVLMVIFLVTAPMLTQAVKLELPNETAMEIADENPIVISVTEHGLYYWGETNVTVPELEERLRQESETQPSRPIHLRADTTVAYGSVSKVLVLSQKYGLSNIGFVTEPR